MKKTNKRHQGIKSVFNKRFSIKQFSIPIIWIPVVLALVICLVSYLSWSFGRTVNYKLLYESKVEETVRKMVKPEALKRP